MDGGSDAAWLDELDNHESLLTLFDALLSESASGEGSNEPVHGANNSATLETVASAPKRHRKRTRRHDEVDLLRQEAYELENKLKMLLQCQGSKRPGPHSVEGSSRRAAWRDTALRQYERLRESKQINLELRQKIQTQLSMTHNLTRHVHRAFTELCLQHVPRFSDQTNAAAIANKRAELLDKAAGMLRSVDAVVFNCFDNFSHDSDQAPVVHNFQMSGASIAASAVGHLVPLPFTAIRQDLWQTQARDRVSVGNCIVAVEQLEQTDSMTLLRFRTSLSLRKGKTQAIQGLALRYSFHGDGRSGAVTISSTFDVHGVSLESKHWAIMQPNFPMMVSTGRPTTELLVKVESTVSPVPEASAVKAFLTHGHKFIHSHLQRRVDDLLLQHRAPPTLRG